MDIFRRRAPFTKFFLEQSFQSSQITRIFSCTFFDIFVKYLSIGPNEEK